MRALPALKNRVGSFFRGKNDFDTLASLFRVPSAFLWPVRLMVRTPGFHPGNRGSIPLRAATFEFERKLKRRSFLIIFPRRIGFSLIPRFVIAIPIYREKQSPPKLKIHKLLQAKALVRSKEWARSGWRPRYKVGTQTTKGSSDAFSAENPKAKLATWLPYA